MRNLIIILACFVLCQLSFAQSEKIEIEGAVIISDTDSSSPQAGTIRWTGQDFEGFNGTVWESLTTCPTDDGSTDPVLNCQPNFVLDNCNLTVSWIHANPLSTSVKYDLIINGIDAGPAVDYPSTSNTVNICNLLGINSGAGTLEVELLFIYNGNPSASAGICTINYEFNLQNAECMTFAQIRVAGREENCYPTGQDYTDAHLAEFLYMNPTVSNWSIDPAGQVICAIDDPEPSSQAFRLPSPSGGNDAAMIQSAINSNSEVVGVAGATYQLGATVNVTNSTKVWDVAINITGSQANAFRVTASNVEFYNSPVNGNNVNNFLVGWRVENTASNFVLSRSGVTNIRTTGGPAAGVWILGANNFKITSNEFKDLLHTSAASATSTSSVLAVLSSNSSGPSPGGYVANNTAENIHTRERNSPTTTDPEFFKQQGYSGEAGRVKIIANRCVNAGARLTKFQHPGGFVASNFFHWRDREGPLSRRIMKSVVNCQLDANHVRAINNRIRIEAEARYGALLRVSPQNNEDTFEDIHFDCNEIELIDMPPEDFYAQGIEFRNKDGNSSDTRNQLINCSARDNVFRSGGGTNYIFTFGPGYIDDAVGLDIDISGNVISTPVIISDFRGSGTSYVP